MKQPQIRLKEVYNDPIITERGLFSKFGERELGVFSVCLVQWDKEGTMHYIEVDGPFGEYGEIKMMLTDGNKTYINRYGNIIGTLIDEKSPE